MTHSKQSIGITQGIGMLVAALLGSGVFIIPAIALSVAGSWSLLAWLLMGMAILPIVFTFASLGRRFPHAGGTAYFVQLAYGDKAARIVSWLFIWVVALGAPVIIITATNFLVNGLQASGVLTGEAAQYQFMFSLVVLALLWGINILGLKAAALIQSILSVLVVGCLLFVSIKTQLVQDFVWPASPFQLNSFAFSLTYILWCFLGIEAIAHLSSDFKKPERDFPITIVVGIIITLLVYCLISVSLLLMGFYGEQADNLNSVVHLVQASLGEKAALWVSYAGFCTCFISISLYYLGFSRLLLSMAEARQAPMLFARINRFNVPHHGLSLAALITVLMLLLYFYMSLSLETLIAYANGLFILIYLAATIAGRKLLTGRQKMLASIAICICAVLFISLAEKALFALALLVVLIGYYRLQPARVN